MAFSIKKIFKKDKSAAAQVQTYSPKESAQEVKSSSDTSKKKPKHGEDGVCCGGCQ
jgi:CCGSCS motif protein